MTIIVDALRLSIIATFSLVFIIFAAALLLLTIVIYLTCRVLVLEAYEFCEREEVDVEKGNHSFINYTC